MPDKDAHLHMAERNGEALHYLKERHNDFPEWVTVTAFYKALHHVEAVFTADPNIRHTSDHSQRERMLKKNRRYSHIWEHYRPLIAASMIARYLRDNDPGDPEYYATFTDYMSPDDVVASLVNHRLRQVQKSCDTLLDL